ncbi:Mobile element protein [Bacillus cereus]|nr:Mobile element protein [Bacillus cereus]
MPISSPYTSIFKCIRILDSTAFQLPDVFSSVYPGRMQPYGWDKNST